VGRKSKPGMLIMILHAGKSMFFFVGKMIDNCPTAGRMGGHSVRIGEYLHKEVYFT